MKRRKRFRKRHRKAEGMKVQKHRVGDYSGHCPNWLVGFTGIVQKKMWPVRRSRTDKLWENKKKIELQEKCNKLERHLKKHHNLLEQLQNLVEDESSDELEQELTEMCTTNAKVLCFIAKGDPVCNLPSNLQGLFEDAIKKDNFLKKELRRQGIQLVHDNHQSVFESAPGNRRPRKNPTISTEKSETSLEQLSSSCDVKRENAEAAKNKRSVPRKRGYQLFVRKFQEPGTIVVDNLKPSDKGELLVSAVKDKIGHLPSACQFMFGSKKLLKNQTLEEQGINNKSNITLRILRGMDPNTEAFGVQTKEQRNNTMPVNDVFVEKPRKEALLNKVSKEQDILIAFEPGPGTNQASDAPKETEGSLKQSFKLNPCDAKLRERNEPVEKHVPSKQVYQLFVRKLQEPGIVVVDNLKPSDKGKHLVTAVEEKIGYLPSGCEFMSGSKKLTKNQTLEEQGIKSESNITLTLNLLGGMNPNPEKTGSDTKPVNAPSKWKKVHVAKWVDEVCDEFEIDPEEVKELKLLNGAGLSCLPKEDWLRRSRQGDFMFMKWNELIKRSSGLDKKTEASNSVLDTLPVKSKVYLTDETEHKGSVNGATKDKEESAVVQVKHVQNISEENTTIGPFGEKPTFDDLGETLSIDQISSQPPNIGDVITVMGLCSSRPNNRGGAGSVLLRNDPPTNSPQFLQLKVDIRANPTSNVRTKYIVGNVLNLQFGDELAIRGRVEALDEGFESKREGFVILPFKVVVDSDYHAAVRKKVETVKPQLFRQFSTPWPIAYGLFPAELDSQPLYQGDKLLEDRDVVWLPPEASIQEIKEFAVAARNCRTTDILVGVKPNGSLTGTKMLKEDVGTRREHLCTALNAILPTGDCAIQHCENASEAASLAADGKSSFVAFMWLQDRSDDCNDLLEDDSIKIVIHVHVTKGTKPLYFTQQDDTHAYVRVGTSTQKLTDFDDLLSRLESLAWRNIAEINIQQEIEKASVIQKCTEKYGLFKQLRLESNQREFKAILGDPKDIILKDYVAKYTAAFLSTEGGDIYFGVEEDQTTKLGHVLGVILSSEERKELLRESANIVCNFWPPVHSSQFFIRFVDLECHGGLSKHVLKYPKTSQKGQGIHILLSTGEQKAEEVQKLAKQITSKLKPGSGRLSLLRVRTSHYCLVSEQPKLINIEQLLADLEKDHSFMSKVKVEEIEETELNKVSRDLCVVHLNVKRSPYPIHLCHSPHTLSFDPSGELQLMQPSELLERFKTSKSEFNIEKFLRSVDNFDRGFNSFVLMASPLKCYNGQDIYGLVIPEWLLVLDFDQHPHDSGHLFDVFQSQHDLHQGERNLFLKTPFDRKLDINPDNGTSWCAVRGYQELAHTLSEGSHGEWNISHGQRVKTHLSDELIVQVNPNQLVVVCLCDEDHEDLLPSMQLLLEHLFSIWSRTTIIFVCPSRGSETFMMKKLIEPLKRSYGNRIKKDNVFVVSPQHLARHLAVKLPAPYCPENAFQIPKKLRLSDGDRTIPETLPQNIRQAVHGHLQIMYLKTGNAATAEETEKAREDFYSGSEISSVGLANGIGIHRQKIKDLKRELKVMLNDKKSHVCMIVLKAERGSGASTLCLQFLYENHERFPCAKLIEFHDSLVTNIEKINQHTKLPLLVFVDSEMASLQDFTDFKNEAERRNLHMILIVVESEVFYVTKNTAGKQGRSRGKSSKLTATPYSAGTSPYQIVELSRELEKSEIPHLVEQLRQIKSIPEDKEKQLKDLQKKAETESSLRKFAYFSLTIFGKKYTGLADYVSYRLSKTNETEAEILEFLALTHVYTDHRFPVNALAGMLQTKVVILESVFTNNDVTELLSPPIQGKGERRISFGEVAAEILKQRAAKKEMPFENFLSDLALRIAEKVLAVREPSKMLDRITRRLFVTSEYESKKFSSLVRTLKDYSKDVARETMKGLVTIFQEGTSMWAHLLAHLAKFHMIEYGAFDEASICIERALKDQPDDVLLHHIRGDIIRLHIQNLKEKEDIDVKEVLKHAIVSSSCFQKVREKRPLMEYGYTSDALVRRIVMQAVVKTVGADGLFTDYLNQFLEEMKGSTNRDPLHDEEKFILALIPDAFDFLRDVAVSEHTDQMKKSLLKEMGSLDAVKGFCEKLKCQMKESSDSGWIDEVVRRTTNLLNILEMETGNLTTEQIDEWMTNLEIHTKVRHDEHWMKLWIRYIRASSKLPSLVSVQKEIEAWMAATKGLSLYANFYNYVIAVLIALKDPTDKEKMEKACKAIEEMQRKRYVKRTGTASQVHSLPLEWLHPKEGRHINSVDSLLHHDDLVKEYLNCSSNTSIRQTRVGREIIERALFERDIKTFQGEVGAIEADWKGKIYLKRYIPVHFIPSNVTPSMPSTGDTVRFALSFGLNGPQAWSVVCQPGMAKARKAENIRPVKELDTEDQSSGLESGEEDDIEIHVEKPLFRKHIPPRSQSDWEVHVGKPLQGIVSFTSTKGYGKIQNPAITGKLFFHASQIVPPVSSLKDLPDNAVVSFIVDKTDSRGVRATNVQVMKDTDEYLPEIREYLRDMQDEEENSMRPIKIHSGGEDKAKVMKSPRQSGRQEGKVVCLLPTPENATHGFIEVTETSEQVFFHQRESEITASDMRRISVGTKVQFSIAKNRNGDKYIAKKVYIQSERPRNLCSCGWEDRKGRGIQEGYICALSKKGFGFISEDGSSGRGIYFHQSDVKGAINWVQLSLGMYVHFKVCENDKGCIAKEVSVIAQAIPTTSVPVVELPPNFPLRPPFSNRQ